MTAPRPLQERPAAYLAARLDDFETLPQRCQRDLRGARARARREPKGYRHGAILLSDGNVGMAVWQDEPPETSKERIRSLREHRKCFEVIGAVAAWLGVDGGVFFA